MRNAMTSGRPRLLEPRPAAYRSAARVAGGLAVALLLGGCGDASSTGAGGPIVFAPEGNRLNAYDPEPPFAKQTVIRSHADDPQDGLDINGEVCFAPGSRLFIAGEDTGQPAIRAGWGVFLLDGVRVGELAARRVGRLVTTFQPARPDGDPYGCGFLSDGRLATTDIGPDASGPAAGQLTIWFPPLDAPNPHHCKLDVEIGTAGAVYVDDQDRIYVASARVDPGVFRYTGPFPTSDDAAGGCDRRDATGAPLAGAVHKERFIASDVHAQTPNAVAASGHGTFYVSSVLNGVIAEYDAAGRFLRSVLEPPASERLGPTPFSTGSPLGFAVAEDGTIFYADLGLVLDGSNIGPGRLTGSVRRLGFAESAADGATPLPPETMDAGLSFPDAVGLLSR
jgi:hypothetical protein